MLLRKQTQRVVNSNARVVPLPQVEPKIEPVIENEKKEEEIVEVTESITDPVVKEIAEVIKEDNIISILPIKQPKNSKKKST